MLYLKYVQSREKIQELVSLFVNLTGPLEWWLIEIQGIGDTGWMPVTSIFHQDMTC